MGKLRRIIFYKKFFLEFYASQSAAVREKINYVLRIVETQSVVPAKFLKSIEAADGLFEIRIEFGGNIFRIFCCMDAERLVVLFHGFQKKTQKTPKREIKKAQKLMNEYFKEKETQHDE